MINDHWSFEERHSLRHPPGCQCARNKAEHGAERTDQLAADRAGNRADDEADEGLEKLHPASRIRSAIADSMPVIDTVFRLPDCPAVIAIALRGHLSRAARNRMSSVLAAPPA